ncbi:hypothetical protein BCR34DRAFT_555217 [Clohesyomyces aquaticus]|uniref:Uncharacterized protein n=1 Tax=Clohesyomyces aquaticus TaxID=1231657 RepID=A0A1Y2A5L9_9PLEO|nr:hypothetical protein BCR34DRAFT_555217 [Clohesyomyces aquaticus]
MFHIISFRLQPISWSISVFLYIMACSHTLEYVLSATLGVTVFAPQALLPYKSFIAWLLQIPFFTSICLYIFHEVHHILRAGRRYEVMRLYNTRLRVSRKEAEEYIRDRDRVLELSFRGDGE